MNRPVTAGLLGIAVGVLGILVGLSSYGIQLEENVGLHGLFRMRGPRKPPDETVIVTMDMASVRLKSASFILVYVYVPAFCPYPSNVSDTCSLYAWMSIFFVWTDSLSSVQTLKPTSYIPG